MIRGDHIIDPAIPSMKGDRKFLAVIGLALALLLVFRIAPCATVSSFALLLTVAYRSVLQRRRR
jgi:hypothetical protein